MSTPITLNVAALNIDCVDSTALADFWAKTLGRPVSPGKVAGDTAVDTTTPETGPRMLFHNVPNPKPGNRFHLVLITDHYTEEIARVTALGANPLSETTLPDVRWTTLADPEGNEFDLVTWHAA
ncbi:VOC family protein [Nocardia alni]|uniref:VOC family protein n=1 Tax=Nocardia alni TaxID=2815723 RepID=UPI001C23CFCF|nr:VOC family protein [Nocardia alni]